MLELFYKLSRQHVLLVSSCQTAENCIREYSKKMLRQNSVDLTHVGGVGPIEGRSKGENHGDVS